MNNIDRLLIKEYKYWKVMLHANQCYLGRCVLWCIRADAADLFEISEEEKNEFWNISKKLNKIIKHLWHPDKMNYASLANRTPHLHIHFIPRYKSEKMFRDFKFLDVRWGKNYAPYDKSFKISDELIEKIRSTISKKFEEQ